MILLGLIAWLEHNLFSCFFVKYLGIECPGCGFQRSLIALLKGDVSESFQLYPALLPVLGMFLFLVMHLVFKFRNGANILKYTFIFNAIIIFGNYILKQF